MRQGHKAVINAFYSPFFRELVTRQVSSARAREAVRGRVHLRQGLTLKGNYLLSAAGDEIHVGVKGDKLGLFAEMGFQASTINIRSLQESACTDGASPVSVTSTVFPLLEGCYIPSVDGDGEVSYTATSGAAFFWVLDGAASTDVSI